jgi:hypothetical protein
MNQPHFIAVLTLLLPLVMSGAALGQTVDAGQNRTLKVIPTTIDLSGTSEMATGTRYSWQQLTGPGLAQIENASELHATASVRNSGTYIFRLTGTDGATTRSDDVTIQIDGDEPAGRDSQVTAYIGTVFDNFVAAEQRTYLNRNLEEVSGNTDNRMLFGFNADFRLAGNGSRQLWLFIETLHGVRSADVDCSEGDDRPAVCTGPDSIITDPSQISGQARFILKNASSFEGLGGFRFEFLPFASRSRTPLSLYVKGHLGFMAVAKNPGDVVDNHFVGLGLIATDGHLAGSYFDVGWGRTDLYAQKRLDRWKYDAYVTFPVSRSSGLAWFRPFAQVTFDSDFGGGADSIQSYLGVNFNITSLW